MAEIDKPSAPAAPAAVADGTPPTPPRRSPGHRGADVKDTVAEMAAKAHEISLEAGSKMAAAMKDVVNAAAGLSGFVIESARDLVQYMVRRGQMTQEEADKLIRQVEEHQPKRKAAPPAEVKHVEKPSHSHAAPATKSHAPTHAPAHAPAKPHSKPHPKPHPKPVVKKASKPAAKAPAKKASKPAPKKPAPKKPAPKKAAAKKPAPKKTAKAKRK